MPTGECPECKKIVALSAKSCPNCGNRDFRVKTNNRLFLRCRNCSGHGCSACSRKGYTLSDQKVDVRDPAKLAGAALTAEQENQRLLDYLQSDRKKASQKLEEEERQRVQSEQEQANKRPGTILRLGFLFAFLGFLILGVGGCIVRIVITDPRDPHYDLNSLFNSWTREAVIIPGLIIIIAVINALRVRPART